MNMIIILFIAFSLQEADNILYSRIPNGDTSIDGRRRCEGICTRCIDEGREPEECYNGVVFNICCNGNDGHTDGNSCECRVGK
jgi:hypothetical protein